MVITSAENDKIKMLRKLLRQKKQRYLLRQYVVECVSPRRVAEMKHISHVYTSDEMYRSDGWPVTHISPELADKLSTTESEPRFLVVLDMAHEEPLPVKGRFVYTDNIQDPGNLGTIIRTAAAFGYDGIILGKGTADPYSPKTVRSSAGYVTSLPLYFADAGVLKGRHVIVTAVRGTDIHTYEPPDDFVIVFGNETAGASPGIAALADAAITIPTHVDSLNVGVAAGVTLYALRPT